MPSITTCKVKISGTPKDKEKLPQIINDHMKWLEDHSKGRRADLQKMNLEGADLSGVDLSFADLSKSCLRNAKLEETKLTGANLNGAVLNHADFTKANLDFVQMSHVYMMDACFEEASLYSAIIKDSLVWVSNFKGVDLTCSILTGSELCDSTFESADLTFSDLYYTNIDNTLFKGANLKYARFGDAACSYYADFTNADLTGVDFFQCSLNEDHLQGAIGFHPHMKCPEEGSFIAWKKCGGGSIVKLLIPETAERAGAYPHFCRASEAVVLDILSQNNEFREEAVSGFDKDFVYRKGEKVRPKETFDGRLLTDGSGIHFFLTRGEAELFEFEYDDDSKEGLKI